MASGIKKLLIAALSVFFMFSLLICFGVQNVNAEIDYSSFEVTGAQLRVDDTKTIRFVTRIEKDVLDSIEGKVEVVTMITPERYLDRADINNADGFKANASVAMNKVVFSDAKGNLKTNVKSVDETDDSVDNPIDYYYFHGCIFGVQDHNMSYPFAARSYITIDGGEPVAYTPYDVSEADPLVTASLFEVAEKAAASGDYAGDDLTILEGYTKTYDVHFVSTDYADVTATVKHGYNLKDVAEIQHPCATVTAISGYASVDSAFITSAPTGDVTVTYSIEHSFVDGACKDCGLTTPETPSFVGENPYRYNWLLQHENSGATIKEVEVNGKTMQKYVENSDATPDNADIKLLIYPSGYKNADYVYAKFYIESYNVNTTSFRFQNWATVSGVDGSVNGRFYDENGEQIALNSSVQVNKWYTYVIDISTLNDGENVLVIQFRPDAGAKVGVGIYIADTYTFKEETPANVTDLNKDGFIVGNPTGTPTALRAECSTKGGFKKVWFEDKLVTNYWTNGVASVRAADLQILNCREYDVATIKFYIKSSAGSTADTANMLIQPYIYGPQVRFNSVVVDENGCLIAKSNSTYVLDATAIKTETWYTMYIDLSRFNESAYVDKTNVSIQMKSDTGAFEFYMGEAYLTAGSYLGEGVTKFAPVANYAVWQPVESDGIITYIYKPNTQVAAYSRRMQPAFTAGKTSFSFEFKVTEKPAALSVKIYAKSYEEVATGAIVAQDNLKMNVWYKATFTISETATNIDGIYPLTQDSNLAIPEATIYFRNPQIA